jgi:excisionase family DNA binding protein
MRKAHVTEVMTVSQLASYLQIPESTLYKLVQAKRIPARKVGRQWRFHRDAVNRWLANSPTITAHRRTS